MPQNWVLTLEIGWDAFAQVLDIPQITASLACREIEETEFQTNFVSRLKCCFGVQELICIWGSCFVFLGRGNIFFDQATHLCKHSLVGSHITSVKFNGKATVSEAGPSCFWHHFQSLYCPFALLLLERRLPEKVKITYPKSEFCSCKRLLKLGWGYMKLGNEHLLLH